MLLRALNEYGGAGGRTPAGYAMKTLGFVLQIDSDGEGCQLHSRYERLETPDGKSRAVAGIRPDPECRSDGQAGAHARMRQRELCARSPQS